MRVVLSCSTVSEAGPDKRKQREEYSNTDQIPDSAIRI